jgi:hypothetical protein
MKGLLTLNETGKNVSFRICGRVHNEIIIGLFIKKIIHAVYTVEGAAS